MENLAIKAENLGKYYRIGQFIGYRTLRESLVNAASTPFRMFRSGSGSRNEKEGIWALRNTSFEIKPGEVVGIIGRNGAGKSTLLKILTRITEPTEGYAEIKGRVGSLLEVGTGFHPELTGRENIYLNGAVLGMKKREIDGRFDEIVDFSGVEKFINTPLKRYSSGMQVRLAFAVAAHLEPEILLVDEVLAVGDAEFQKKCLGKMGELAGGGRTVIFVSHNLGAVQRLCRSAFLLEQGNIISTGITSKVIDEYYILTGSGKKTDTRNIEIPEGGIGFTEWSLKESSTGNKYSCFTRDACTIRLRLSSNREVERANFGLALWANDGTLIWAMRSLDYGEPTVFLRKGDYEVEFSIPDLPIKPGTYQVLVSVNDADLGTLDSWYAQPNLIILPHEESGIPEQWQGIINIKGEFNIKFIDSKYNRSKTKGTS